LVKPNNQKTKMPLSSKLAFTVKVTDIETGLIKTLNSNAQAAKYLNISEWTIRKDKNLYNTHLGEGIPLPRNAGVGQIILIKAREAQLVERGIEVA
jgi:hypothetical protein